MADRKTTRPAVRKIRGVRILYGSRLFEGIIRHMGNVGIPELIIIFTIALIIFGPRKLPELGKSLGKSLAEFKRASNELKSTLDEEIRMEERRSAERQEPPRVASHTGPATTPVHTDIHTDVHTDVEHDESLGNVPRQNGSA